MNYRISYLFIEERIWVLHPFLDEEENEVDEEIDEMEDDFPPENI